MDIRTADRATGFDGARECAASTLSMLSDRLGKVLGIGLTVALCGCSVFDSRIAIEKPPVARPQPVVIAPPSNGAIFQQVTYQPLFEDKRARNVGDTLTVNINENMTASKAAATDASRQGANSFGVPTIFGLPGKALVGSASLSATSQSTFAGKGDSSANNVFTGTITVTVFEVLPNGNMKVSGEKQIGINTGSEYIRLSGVVNPTTIAAGNVVSSTQVADARIEYRGKGYIDEAQTMGWMQRAFQSILPF